jgi:hypothetical protein
MNNAADPVAAVRESHATGEIADIFLEIRSALGTTSVNLVWRHLATLPGALQWCWEAVSPIFNDGSAQEAAARYRNSLSSPVFLTLPKECLEIFSVEEVDIPLIRSTLNGYFVSCSINLLSLNALLRALDEGRPVSSTCSDSIRRNVIRSRPVPQEMARLLDLSEIPPHVADLAWRLNGLCSKGDKKILAAVYRYLANWPPLLCATWLSLAPMAASGVLDDAVDASLSEAEIYIGDLSSRVVLPISSLSHETLHAVRKALQEFGQNAIVKSIPVARALLGFFETPETTTRPVATEMRAGHTSNDDACNLF